MAHLAARMSFRLAVKVQPGMGFLGEILPVFSRFAQKIGHNDIAVALGVSERPARNGPNMLLELRHDTGVHCPMAGIVDARRDLIDDQPFPSHFASQEQLDPDYPDIVDSPGDAGGDVARRRCRPGGDPRGHDRFVQYVIGVPVIGDVIDCNGAVPAARGDDGHFLLEIDEGLEDCGPADRGPGRIEPCFGIDGGLTLTVIAEAPSLEDGRAADLSDGFSQALLVIDCGKGRRRETDLGQKGLLSETILAGGQGLGPRRQGLETAQYGGRLGWHILEFVCDDVDGSSEGFERLAVVIGGASVMGRDLKGRAFRLGREDMALQSETRGGEGQHTAKLAAAQYADDGIGRQRLFQPYQAPSFGRSATAAVCLARQSLSRLASAWSLRARMLAARRAALMAPGLPMASVPTGMPGGIWTME